MKTDIKNKLKLKAGVIVSNEIMSGNEKVDAIVSLFEELIKWNRVEDGLPEIDKQILFKRYDGIVYLGKLWKGLYSQAFVSNAITIEGVTEWKYII